jgi:hypothetical protein
MPKVLMPAIEELWKLCRDHRVGEVAARFGLTPQDLVARFKQAGLMGNGPKDPSPEEIAKEARALRRRWTPEVRQSRWVGARGRQLA